MTCVPAKSEHDHSLSFFFLNYERKKLEIRKRKYKAFIWYCRWAISQHSQSLLIKTESCWNTLRHISRTIFNSFLAAEFFGSIFWRDNKSLAAESYCPNACQIPTEQQLSWLQTVTNTIFGWKKYSALNMWYTVTNTLKSIQLEARWATSSNYCIRFELGRVVWLFVQE